MKGTNLLTRKLVTQLAVVETGHIDGGGGDGGRVRRRRRRG